MEAATVPVSSTVTYTEMRWWARTLQAFTASDMANVMAVHYDIGVKAIRALCWHGICEETGEDIDGPFGLEPIVYYLPLPPGPTHHPHYELPEHSAVREMGGLLLYDVRGQPVRIRTERQMRKSLSTPGARQMHVNRERAFQAQELARAQAAETAKIKAAREKAEGPKWKRKKKASVVVP